MKAAYVNKETYGYLLAGFPAPIFYWHQEGKEEVPKIGSLIEVWHDKDGMICKVIDNPNPLSIPQGYDRPPVDVYSIFVVKGMIK